MKEKIFEEFEMCSENEAKEAVEEAIQKTAQAIFEDLDNAKEHEWVDIKKKWGVK